MHTDDLLDRLKLDDELVLDEKVDAIPAVESESLVLNGQWPLQVEPQRVELQLARKALLICRFQEPGSENFVHLNRASDDSV